MKYYSVMPSHWDYAYEKEVEELNEQGYYTPCEVKGLVRQCGSLYPYITTKKSAIEFVQNLKTQFPYVCFDLMVGKTWGEMELVQSF